MNKFAQYLEDITVGDPRQVANLAMYPLFRERRVSHDGFDAAEYLAFDDALAREWVTVTEVDEDGSVPTLLLNNTGDKPILLLDGEQLVGAKQNRTVNLTLLIAAGVKTEIPVSCVEAGRWSHRSRRFSGSDFMHFNRGRREKMEQLNVNMRHLDSRASNQSEVWRSIEEKRDAFGAHAPTSAMDDIYAENAQKLECFAHEIQPLPNQVGAVFATDGELSGFDLFASAEHLARYLPKLVRSHSLDALESASTSDHPAPPPSKKVSAFLKAFGSAKEEVYDAIGLGQDIRVESSDRVGAGLAWQEQPVHLAGFPKVA